MSILSIFKRTVQSLIIVASMAFSAAAFAGETLDLKVDGMVCGACAAKLKTQITSINGVEDCSVSVEKGTARVTVADGADLMKVAVKMKDAVAAAGLSLSQ